MSFTVACSVLLAGLDKGAADAVEKIMEAYESGVADGRALQQEEAEKEEDISPIASLLLRDNNFYDLSRPEAADF